MGKKSVKESKNIYQECREECNLTREKASELLETVSPDRLYKIENEKSPYPDEVLAMSKVYKKPSLCNYYCTHECEIGKLYVPEVSVKELNQITLEMLATLNSLTKEKDRLVEIAVDGVISENERPDFERIQATLNDMSAAISSLQLWVQTSLDAEG